MSAFQPAAKVMRESRDREMKQQARKWMELTGISKALAVYACKHKFVQDHTQTKKETTESLVNFLDKHVSDNPNPLVRSTLKRFTETLEGWIDDFGFPL